MTFNNSQKNKILPSIIIRLATIANAELIAEISRQTFFDTFASFNTKENMDKFMNEQFSKESLMAEVGDAGNIFLIAYLDEEPVGYTLMRESNSPKELGSADTIEIVRIYNEQKAIGKGVGKSLMLRCIEIAKERNKDIIWLGVWEHNDNAVSFYKKFGYEQFGTHIFMLGDDPQTDLLLKKNL